MGVKTAKINDEYKISAKNRDIFSDFNHAFLPHPNTGQISRKTNIDSVKMALRNLLMTDKYERLRNPDFGGNIKRYLFEPLEDEQIPDEMKDHIEYMVKTFEPRVRLIDTVVTTDPDNNTINISIEFSVLTSAENQNLDITLYRVR